MMKDEGFDMMKDEEIHRLNLFKSEAELIQEFSDRKKVGVELFKILKSIKLIKNLL